MSRTTKNDKIQRMLKVLENCKNVTSNMDFYIRVAEDSVKDFLYEMARANKKNQLNEEKERKENNKVQMEIHNLLLEHYFFSDRSDGTVSVSLVNSHFLQDNKLVEALLEKIGDSEHFAGMKEKLEYLKLCKTKFFESKKKLVKIEKEKSFEEFEEMFENIGSFDLCNGYLLKKLRRDISSKMLELQKQV